MKDVELVIKIPERIYKQIMTTQSYIFGFSSEKSLSAETLKAIRTGIPIPKGHGKIVDVDKIWDEVPDISSPLENHFKTYDFCRFLENTPAIIEADKEDKG